MVFFLSDYSAPETKKNQDLFSMCKCSRSGIHNHVMNHKYINGSLQRSDATLGKYKVPNGNLEKLV